MASRKGDGIGASIFLQMPEDAPEALGLKFGDAEREIDTRLGGKELALAAVDGAGAHLDIAFVTQFLEDAIEALFGDLQNIEQFGDREAGGGG